HLFPRNAATACSRSGGFFTGGHCLARGNGPRQGLDSAGTSCRCGRGNPRTGADKLLGESYRFEKLLHIPSACPGSLGTWFPTVSICLHPARSVLSPRNIHVGELYQP